MDLDFSGLSAHQTKTLEMNIQVKLLELESRVEAERSKLAQLRRQHYKTSVDGSVEQWADTTLEGSFRHILT